MISLAFEDIVSLIDNDKDKKVIVDHYYFGYTLTEIAKRMKLSVERIRQRKIRALRRLKHPHFKAQIT